MKSVKENILFRSKYTWLFYNMSPINFNPNEIGIYKYIFKSDQDGYKADYLIARKFWNTELNNIFLAIYNYIKYDH
jgi:hypothetical protein